MEGYKLFLEELEKLDYYTRYKVLSNIFGINVRVYVTDVVDERIIFRLFDGNTVYNFNFILDKFDEDDCNYIKARIRNRIIICDVYVENLIIEILLGVNDGNNFYKFLKILKDGYINYFDSFL